MRASMWGAVLGAWHTSLARGLVITGAFGPGVTFLCSTSHAQAAKECTCRPHLALTERALQGCLCPWGPRVCRSTLPAPALRPAQQHCPYPAILLPTGHTHHQRPSEPQTHRAVHLSANFLRTTALYPPPRSLSPLDRRKEPTYKSVNRVFDSLCF